jgi:hypothetical protein
MKTKEEKISTIPLLEILAKYAVKHAVAFSGEESNAIVEAMYEYASEETEKLNQLVRVQDQLIDVLNEPNYEFLGVTHNQNSDSAGDIISRYINKNEKILNNLKPN